MSLSAKKKGAPLDVFISYSHLNEQFVHQLDDELTHHHLTTWLDTDDVFPAGKFWEDIYAGIEEAGAFICILSPAYIQSEPCTKELDYARTLEKKIICVNFSDKTDIPRMRDTLKVDGRDWVNERDWIDTASFDHMRDKVLEAILTDKDAWIQAEQWLRMATEWNKDRKRNSGLLLHGKELKRAEQWKKRTDEWHRYGIDKRPQPLPIHIEFIRASRSAVNRLIAVILVIIFLFASLSTGTVFALLYHDTTHVSTLQDNNNPGSLRYDVNQAPPQSTITFDANVRGTILLTNGDLAIAKSLTIRGPGAGLLSLSGGKSGSVVRVAHGVTITISGLAFKNSDTAGGFIDNQGTLNLSSTIVSGNTSTNNTSAQFTGGGISNHGTLTLSSSTISGNTSKYSVGGIFNDNEATLTLNNSVVSDNHAGAVSGGLLNTGTLTINNTTISGNTSYGAGGGIYNYGTLTMNNSTVSGNKTIAAAAGGGIYNIGALRMNNSTVSGNMSGEGGGIINQNALTLINSTVSGNSASRDGGGILIAGYTAAGNQPSSAQTDLTFSTVYGNIAPTGGAIAIADYNFDNNKPINQISVVQTIASIAVSDPAHPGPDIVGMLKTYGYNLFQENSGATFDPTTRAQHETDRALSANDLTRLFAHPAELQNNGGPTRTYALGPGSPAIDVVPYDFCYLTDQRGVKRPDGNEHSCDIGAYEYSDASSTGQPKAPATTRTQATALAQVIAHDLYPAYLPGQGTLAFVDPLSQPDGSQWSSGRNPITGAACEFTRGAYHITQSHNGYFRYCDAHETFSNFALEVQLTIIQGDCGGMMLRDDNKGNYYQFELCQDGRYWVYKYVTNSAARILDSGSSSAMKTGLGQQNKIAVVAQGSTLLFYVNEQQLDQVQDTSYTSGIIDLMAEEQFGHATDVAYTNARLWTL